MRYLGGVPAAIVPDNLKAAVSRSDRNEPVINEVFAAFAEHYGCAVIRHVSGTPRTRHRWRMP